MSRNSVKKMFTTKCFLILRSPTENENVRERFLASARNDDACHLDEVRDLSLLLFLKEGTKVKKYASSEPFVSFVWFVVRPFL